MTTFAVFGMTKSAATKLARKLPAGSITESEYNAKVMEVTDAIMRSKRIIQISSEFDAPQFAEEFLHIALRMEVCRGLVIKAKQVVTDGAGKLVYSKRGKKPRKAWLPYTRKSA